MQLRDIEMRHALPRPRARVSEPRVQAREMAALRNHRLLRVMSASELRQVLALGRTVAFAAGQTIARRGDPVDAVLFIINGSARAELITGSHGVFKLIIDRLGTGDDVGLFSVVDGAPHLATVVATEDVRALAVPRATLRACLVHRTRWYRALAELAMGRLCQPLP